MPSAHACVRCLLSSCVCLDLLSSVCVFRFLHRACHVTLLVLFPGLMGSDAIESMRASLRRRSRTLRSSPPGPDPAAPSPSGSVASADGAQGQWGRRGGERPDSGSARHAQRDGEGGGNVEQDGEGGGNVGMLGRLSGFLGLRLPLQSAPARQGGEWRNAGEAEAGEEDDKEVDGAEEVRVQVADTRRTDLVTIPICVLCPVSCILSRPHTPSRSQHWRNTVHVSCAWPPFFLSFLPVDTAPCLPVYTTANGLPLPGTRLRDLSRSGERCPSSCRERKHRPANLPAPRRSPALVSASLIALTVYLL